jgi:diaminopimelate epimerase|tara:strand:+ start:29831 stop:30661 length:831 start_codon:yes stop_codon:yes gene_type:complete
MLAFTKMQSLGNDFVLIDGVRQPFPFEIDLIRNLADRKKGIGFDQLLVAVSGEGNADFSMRIFNRDGSEAEQCGNGARCFARFLRDQHLTDLDQFIVKTINQTIGIQINSGLEISVDMGKPNFDPAFIPFVASSISRTYDLDIEGEIVEISVLSFGNPHAVLLVNDIEAAPVERLGPLIESHSRFPNRTNVGFAEPVSRSRIKLRVWERGVGETLACGSGACAAVVACHKLGKIDDEVEIEFKGGIATAKWIDKGSVLLSGPAETVFHGQIDLRFL